MHDRAKAALIAASIAPGTLYEIAVVQCADRGGNAMNSRDAPSEDTPSFCNNTDQ
ncbi:hypothetical protein AA102526_1209 [Asaia lannensis NBRC 102526]|nr:hypothetical protein AA102526_1209 [Asaia lannensis NBRC 102526]